MSTGRVGPVFFFRGGVMPGAPRSLSRIRGVRARFA